MTLDEAIAHAEKVAEELEREEFSEDIADCAIDHQQLADWLRELKKARGIKEEHFSIVENLKLDVGYYRSICDGSWPSADEVMKVMREQRKILMEKANE